MQRDPGYAWDQTSTSTSFEVICTKIRALLREQLSEDSLEPPPPVSHATATGPLLRT